MSFDSFYDLPHTISIIGILAPINVLCPMFKALHDLIIWIIFAETTCHEYALGEKWMSEFKGFSFPAFIDFYANSKFYSV